MKQLSFVAFAFAAISILGLAACGAKVSTDPQSGPSLPSVGTTWSDSEKQTYLGKCPFGEKQCNCVIEAFEKKGVSYSQYEANPSLTGDAVSSQEFSDCMN